MRNLDHARHLDGRDYTVVTWKRSWVIDEERVERPAWGTGGAELWGDTEKQD